MPEDACVSLTNDRALIATWAERDLSSKPQLITYFLRLLPLPTDTGYLFQTQMLK